MRGIMAEKPLPPLSASLPHSTRH